MLICSIESGHGSLENSVDQVEGVIAASIVEEAATTEQLRSQEDKFVDQVEGPFAPTSIEKAATKIHRRAALAGEISG